MQTKKRKKMLFLSILVVILAIIGIIIAYFLIQTNLRKSELAETIHQNPNTTAVVAYTINDQGEFVEDGKAIFLNPDTPLVTASTMKVVVLAAYENAVVQGVLNPEEKVNLADVEKYYLPLTDGGAHISGLSKLGIKVDDLGFALDQSQTISLDDIANIMIHNSGNAETDYLIDRLGIAKVNSVLGMDHHTPIKRILGTALAIMDPAGTLADPEKRNALIKKVGQGDFSDLEKLEDLYLNNQQWRKALIESIKSGEYVKNVGQIDWLGQVEASQLLPRGTAREYAQLMAKIASSQFISTEVSVLMQKKLETMPYDWLIRLLFYHRYGDKDGLTAGVINLVSYAKPKTSTLAGQTRIVVIFTNELSYPTWATQVQYNGIYFLQTDLAKATGVFNSLSDLE